MALKIRLQRNGAAHKPINIERADYWVSVGAKPTDTVKALIKKAKAESANA